MPGVLFLNSRECTLTAQCFARIYPDGDRVSSSNYNPDQAWSVGCQLVRGLTTAHWPPMSLTHRSFHVLVYGTRAGFVQVALNLQTPDFSVRKNYAKFENNGRCGYVLKPLYLRRSIKDTKDTNYPLVLSVTVRCFLAHTRSLSRSSRHSPSQR